MESKLLFAILILQNSRVMPRKHEIYVLLSKHAMYPYNRFDMFVFLCDSIPFKWAFFLK